MYFVALYSFYFSSAFVTIINYFTTYTVYFLQFWVHFWPFWPKVLDFQSWFDFWGQFTWGTDPFYMKRGKNSNNGNRLELLKMTFNVSNFLWEENCRSGRQSTQQIIIWNLPNWYIWWGIGGAIGGISIIISFIKMQHFSHIMP